jgi:hypothetical protein
MIARALLGLALLLLPAAALGQHAHEHGVATLKVALDGRKLVVELESPLDNLVGFEHAPRNDRQRAALKKMEASLEAGDRLLRPSAAAACTLRGITIEHPYRATAAAGPAPADSARTKASEARGKGPGPAETHAELSATYELECAKPEALDRIDVLFLDAFPGMKRLKAQTASPRGQSSKTLTARSRSLSF